MTIPMLMPNAAAAAVSMGLGAKGGARTVVSACASGTESIANAYEHLQLGLADVVVAGGTEAVIHPLPIAAFAAMQALSKRNDDPARASRPYDKDRDGFVLGEGAATLVLETLEHATARGARIYAELAGGGITSDSYHITAPDPEGLGASRAVHAALKQAGASVDDVTHINAHATSTPVGDIAEFAALKSVFGDRVVVGAGECIGCSLPGAQPDQVIKSSETFSRDHSCTSGRASEIKTAFDVHPLNVCALARVEPA